MFLSPLSKIIHQGVDTLLVSYISTNEDDYKKFYSPLLEKLEELKKDAQQKEAFDNNSRFIIFDFLGFGNFKIYAQGKGVYRYIIENEDCTISLSTTKFGANDFQTAQLKVEFRASYLFTAGHKKAFELVNKIIYKCIGETKKLCLRIDLATDIQGVKYTGLDKFRFQTFNKVVDFEQMHTFTKHKKTTGYQFGAGAFVFRIYDKKAKIKTDPSSSYIKYKWILNGYNESEDLPVFRHEAQFRRETLKKYVPKDVNCEVSWHFSQLEKLWHLATNKVTYTDLTSDEIVRISEKFLSSEAIKKIFQRAKKDDTRLKFWDSIKKWDNTLANSISKFEYVKEAKEKTALKYAKAFVSSTYKSLGSDPANLLKIIETSQREIFKNEDITLHEYGELKVLSSLMDNAKIVERYSLNAVNDYSYKVQDKFIALNNQLTNINHPVINTAEFYLTKRRLSLKNAS